MKKFDIIEAYIVTPDKKIPIPEQAIDELFKLLDEAELVVSEFSNEDGHNYNIEFHADFTSSTNPLESEQQVIDAVAHYLRNDIFFHCVKVIHNYDGEMKANYWEGGVEHIYIRKGCISHFLQKFMPEANIDVDEITEIVIKNEDMPHI